MTNHKIYRIFEEERILVYEEVLDREGNIISYKDYQAEETTEGINEYEPKGRLISEKEVIEGKEASRVEIEYNENGDIIESRQIVDGEVFETVKTEYNENTIIVRNLQWEEELSRTVETKDGLKYIKEFYENGKLEERHNSEFNSHRTIQTIKILDGSNNHIATRVLKYDSQERITEFIEYIDNENIMVKSTYDYSNDLLITEEHEDYNKDIHYIIDYEYDDKGNIVHQEDKTPSDKLLGFRKLKYNEENQLIFETGYSVGNFDAIYGTYVNGENYTFEHEYMS